MEIELKSLKHYARRSQETYCFDAKLYVDNVYTADVDNDGNGGQNRVTVFNKTQYQLFTEYIDQLPSDSDGFKPNEDTFLSCLVAEELDKKEIEKSSKKGIVFKDPKSTAYFSLISWNKNIEWLLDNRQHNIIQEKVNELLDRGCVILNKNLTGIITTK